MGARDDGRFSRFARDAGAALTGCIAGLLLEHAAVGLRFRPQFTGFWELTPDRIFVMPMLAAVMLAASPLAVLAWRASLAPSPASRRALAAAGGAAGLAQGYGVTFGRHFASWALRAPFVVAAGAAGAAVLALGLPALVARARARPWVLAALMAALGAALIWADAAVLPRLYPAFHAGLFATSWLAWSLAGLAIAPQLGRGVWVSIGFAALGVVLGPLGAHSLQSYDNMRLLLVEHAPWEGRGVRLASWIAPPPPEATVKVAMPGEVPRALDWGGRDVLLITVDALRADHVGAYGYGRPTTPHLDALAREGALFEHAYCPTPHTSYSVTSLMTGKYMRPLLTLGLGEDSETWAAASRRYGYRTAAFYPPAVFFIDPDRFTAFRDRGLDFEYRKEEFAGPALREAQMRDYLAHAAPGTPLFLWVHFFEPHEPYVAHSDHRFGDGQSDLDRYDGEIAEADDGIGAIVGMVRKARPRVVVIVTADHGEEFGDHGGRYHGSSVYEEQVRVPLVVVGPGVRPARVATPVQTIDLFPTTLSALGIPRPARVRGRDLGPLLAGKDAPDDAGLALAETDDYALLAERSLRLVCQKHLGACALYDIATDPHERHDIARDRAADTRRMHAELDTLISEQGKLEGQGTSGLPEALRRAMQGDVTAAPDTAGLLDDADVKVRRKAAAALYDLRSADVAPSLRRALQKDEDADVRRWCALALLRVGQPASPEAQALAKDPDPAWRRRAGLAFAEQGDDRGAADLAAWLGDKQVSFARQREILSALGKVRSRAAVPALVGALDDVRLRPYLADALGAIGDASASGPLLAQFAKERYVTTRPHEARALLALGVRQELREPLRRFAGVPEPMAGAVATARQAALLDAAHGGWTAPAGATPGQVAQKVALSEDGPARLLVLVGGAGKVSAKVDGVEVPLGGEGTERTADLPDRHAGRVAVEVAAAAASGVLGFWVVPRAPELPPPAPKDAGTD